jgi:hypothetical protein
MRRFLSLLLLSLSMLSAPAWAADAPTPDATPAHAARKTWQQHFTEANVAHNGHLTLEEAQGGYADIAKHFEDIDADHKGYVTETDIRAWRVMRKAAHRLMKQPEDKLRPRSAVQRTYPDFRATPVAGKQTLAILSGSASSKP